MPPRRKVAILFLLIDYLIISIDSILWPTPTGRKSARKEEKKRRRTSKLEGSFACHSSGRRGGVVVAAALVALVVVVVVQSRPGENFLLVVRIE